MQAAGLATSLPSVPPCPCACLAAFALQQQPCMGKIMPHVRCNHLQGSLKLCQVSLIAWLVPFLKESPVERQPPACMCL